MDGVLVIDKPVGPSSHDVVARVRRVLGERRIGHTGTLDPAASGVLPLVIGRATRLARFLSSSDKEYLALVQLGMRTTTFDMEGDPVGSTWTGPLPSRDQIDAALEGFRGTFEQRPPLFSAKKIGGERSYRLARRQRMASAGAGGDRDVASENEAATGNRARAAGSGLPDPDVDGTAPRIGPAPCRVTVHSLELTGLDHDRVALRIECAAGFYVRALAHDLGERLGTGACLAALRRIRSGDHHVDAAIALEAAERDHAAARASVIPLAHLLAAWPAVVLTESGVARAIKGRDLGPADTPAAGELPCEPHVRLFDGSGRLVAIGEPARTRGLLHPAVVFM